jgi:hypothetical protein
MKQLNLRGMNKSVINGLVAIGAIVASSVACADPVDTAITALGATATSYIADALGVALIVAGGFWGISMLKKAMSAAK